MAYDSLTNEQLLTEILDRQNQVENLMQQGMARTEELMRRIKTATPTYAPILVNGLAPSELSWAGRKWRVNCIAEDNEGFDYCITTMGDRIRFEVRPDDPPSETKPEKRRSELSGSIYGDPTRLPNGVLLKGGFNFIHHPWTGMESTWGGVFGQVHMGSKVGGSPALAFRRHQNGNFMVTTRGEFDDAGTRRYEAPLSFGAAHRVDYSVVLHPTNGKLIVALDGKEIVNASGSIGHSAADSFWNIGVYCSGGVTCPVIAEYWGHSYPG